MKNLRKIFAGMTCIAMILSSAGTMLAAEDGETNFISNETKNETGETVVYNTGLLDSEIVILSSEDIDKELNDYSELVTEDRLSMVYNSKWDKYSTNYYYNQLSTEYKEIWDAWDVLCLNYLNSEADAIEHSSGKYHTEVVSMPEMTDQEINDFVCMFRMSNPQYYFINNSIYSGTGADGTLVVALGIYDAFADGEDRQAATEAIKKQIETWESKVNAYSGEGAKVKAIHDLICNKVDYNYDFVDKKVDEEVAITQSVYSVFCMDLTVCAGYAEALQLMCNGMGIDAICVTSMDHQWNKVRINDSWYNVDCTWDDEGNDEPIIYEFFERSDHYYDNAQQYESHQEEDRWLGYLPKCTLDTNPVSPYYVPGTLPTISKTAAVPGITIAQATDGYRVTITSSTSGADIYYTTDGTDPSAAHTRATKYTGVFTSNDPGKIKAIAVCNGYWDSAAGELSLDKVNGLKVTSYSKNEVSLSWNKVLGAEGYLIYGQKNGKYGYVGMTTKGTTYTDTKAVDTDYNFYWVFPYVKDATGKMRTGGCAKYTYAKGIIPAVYNLKASSVTSGVKLSWSGRQDADGYLIYGIRPNGKYGYIGMTTNGNIYTDKKASKTDYTFYWVFPYHKNSSGKMIVGGSTKYTYGRAK